MSSKLSESISIHEQRRCLDKLDEEIEKTINELDSLNSYTLNQAKKPQRKVPVNKFHTPNRSVSVIAQGSPNGSFVDSVGLQDKGNAIKILNQEDFQQSSGSLIAKADSSKDLGYSSIETNLQNPQRENINLVIEGSAKSSALPANFWITINEKKKQKSQGTAQKENSPRSKLADFMMLSRESTIGSCGTNKENSNVKGKSVQNMMEFHKMSNLDLPKEKIYGNSKPEHFFGFQQNLRRQSTNQQQQQKSIAGNQVEDRLIQYGRDKEERRRAIMEGKEDISKKLSYAKPPKAKLSSSFMVRNDEQNLFYEEEDLTTFQVKEAVGNENIGVCAISNHPIFARKSSLQPSEVSGSQLNQLVGVHQKGESLSATQKDKSDPFYQLYKEGCGESMNINESFIENRRVSGESAGQLFNRSASQSNIASSGGNYQKIESRYMNGLAESSKSPTKGGAFDSIKPSFRPQLSKKSLEIAAKLGNSFQRLVDGSANQTQENKKKLLKELNSELTFKPKINKKSEQLDEQFKASVFNGDELHRWDQLYLMKDKYNIEKEMRRQERDRIEKENDECTFHPQLNPVSSRIYRDKSVDFADRASAWKQMKDRKLDRERDAVLEKEVKDCTFQPAIIASPIKLATSRSAINLNDISQMSIKGLDQHFEKIDRANRMKKELESRQVKCSGKGWKRQITVPKEFQLSKKSGSLSPFTRQNSCANLDISTEQKIYKNVLFVENGRDTSPQAVRRRDAFNDSWISKNCDQSIAYDNFGDAVVKLHYELQRMDI